MKPARHWLAWLIPSSSGPAQTAGYVAESAATPRLPTPPQRRRQRLHPPGQLDTRRDRERLRTPPALVHVDACGAGRSRQGQAVAGAKYVNRPLHNAPGCNDTCGL